jgi:hypothetical protein
MRERTFVATSGLKLSVKSRRSAIILELGGEYEEEDRFYFIFRFTPKDYDEIIKYLEEEALKCWPNFSPREADSEGSDYFEYYDKEFDNNGYIKLWIDDALAIERPSRDSKKLYQFNKRRMESFIYDLNDKRSGAQ